MLHIAWGIKIVLEKLLFPQWFSHGELISMTHRPITFQKMNSISIIGWFPCQVGSDDKRLCRNISCQNIIYFITNMKSGKKKSLFSVLIENKIIGINCIYAMQYYYQYCIITSTFQSIVQTKIFFKRSETETLPNLLNDIFAVWMHENIKK